MDYGRIDRARGIDFRLPPTDEATRSALARSGGRRPLDVLVSAPVWNVKDWIGSLYPADARARDLLPHYGRAFRAIELNVTHYRVPDERGLAQWIEQTPAGFRFCPKVPQEISHRDGLGAQPALARAFFAACATLARADRLGLPFLQLPPDFPPSSAGELDALARLAPPGLPLAVEFRHPAWFTDAGQLAPLGRERLERLGWDAVITDTAGRRDAAHASLTGPRVLVRYLSAVAPDAPAGELHPDDPARLRAWAERLVEWGRFGLEEAQFCLHDIEQRHTPALIALFARELARAGGPELARRALPPPPAPPAQASLF